MYVRAQRFFAVAFRMGGKVKGRAVALQNPVFIKKGSRYDIGGLKMSYFYKNIYYNIIDHHHNIIDHHHNIIDHHH